MKRPLLLGIGLLLGVAGCGEQVQTNDSGRVRKADARTFEIRDNGHLAPGWTPGNHASWEAQMKKRAQAQNDFAAPPS